MCVKKRQRFAPVFRKVAGKAYIPLCWDRKALEKTYFIPSLLKDIESLKYRR